MESVAPIFSFNIGGFPINITRDIIVQWAVILILGIAAYILTRNLKRVPDKRQVVLETLYTTIEGLVKNNMGESYVGYIPYVGTLVIYLLVLNLMGIIGI
ncbi:MAG: F0F1 ATP synthase subunit A, partial [Clostridium sp.]|nr:F0F1 ATP synthase subunit A [Clostridium sp.]